MLRLPVPWRMTHAMILADEPTGNLILVLRRISSTFLNRWLLQGKTILIVTHDPSITQRTDQTIILSDGEIIDQTVARALPFLSHPQMLAATHQAQKQTFAPHAEILGQGKSVDHFFMIFRGEVEIVVNTKKAAMREAWPD